MSLWGSIILSTLLSGDCWGRALFGLPSEKLPCLLFLNQFKVKGLLCCKARQLIGFLLSVAFVTPTGCALFTRENLISLDLLWVNSSKIKWGNAKGQTRDRRIDLFLLPNFVSTISLYHQLLTSRRFLLLIAVHYIVRL